MELSSDAACTSSSRLAELELDAVGNGKGAGNLPPHEILHQANRPAQSKSRDGIASCSTGNNVLRNNAVHLIKCSFELPLAAA